MDSGAQDVPRCDVCEEGVARMHCDPCFVSLCKMCVGEHISADLSKPHKIVSFKDRNSTPLLHKCSFHDNEHCEMHCRHCDFPVCPSCLSSDEHLGHSLSKILPVLDERKERVLKEKATLEEAIYPTYQFIASDVENTKVRLEKKYGDLLTVIEKQEEDWHDEVREVADGLRTRAKRMKGTQIEKLQQHLDALKTKLANIQAEIGLCKKALDTNDVSRLANVECYVEKYTKLPEKFEPDLPKFTPGELDRENLGKLFGKLSLISFSSVDSGYSLKMLHQPQEPGSTPHGELLADPAIVIRIRTGHGHLYDVSCQSEKEIWTSGNDAMVRLYKIHPKSQLKSIRTKSKKAPTNIAVTRAGDLMYSDGSSRTVNVVRDRAINTVVKLQNWRPQGVCSTSSGDLLVIMDSEDKKESRIVLYSGGTAKHFIQFDDQGEPLYSTGTIKYITENRNLDICVTDSKQKAVVVVSEAEGLRFRYTAPSPTPRNKDFHPVGISTDSGGRILTADYFNHCVHVIDRDGHFLRYIDCGLQDPWGVCVDPDDYLYVVECILQQVTKIRYLQ